MKVTHITDGLRFWVERFDGVGNWEPRAGFNSEEEAAREADARSEDQGFVHRVVDYGTHNPHRLKG